MCMVELVFIKSKVHLPLFMGKRFFERLVVLESGSQVFVGGRDLCSKGLVLLCNRNKVLFHLFDLLLADACLGFSVVKLETDILDFGPGRVLCSFERLLAGHQCRRKHFYLLNHRFLL